MRKPLGICKANVFNGILSMRVLVHKNGLCNIALYCLCKWQEYIVQDNFCNFKQKNTIAMCHRAEGDLNGVNTFNGPGPRRRKNHLRQWGDARVMTALMTTAEKGVINRDKRWSRPPP